MVRLTYVCQISQLIKNLRITTPCKSAITSPAKERPSLKAMKGLKVVKVSWGWLLLQPEMSALQFRPMFEVDTLRSISLGNLPALKGQQMKHLQPLMVPQNVHDSAGNIHVQNCMPCRHVLRSR